MILAPALLMASFAANPIFRYDSAFSASAGYTDNPSPTCGIPANRLAGRALAAVDESRYLGGTACGAFVRILNTNTASGDPVEVDAMIADLCPSTDPLCDNPDSAYFDMLGDTAFAKLNPAVGGRLPSIEAEWIPAPVTGNVALRFGTGVSRWFATIQALDHRNPVASMEISTDSGKSWVAGARAASSSLAPTGSFFSFSNPTTTFKLRLTDIFGQTIEAAGIAPADTLEWSANAQFPVWETSTRTQPSAGTLPALALLGNQLLWRGADGVASILSTNGSPVARVPLKRGRWTALPRTARGVYLIRTPDGGVHTWIRSAP